MWNKPTKDELAKIPDLCSSEKTKVGDKLIYMHFFGGPGDWYVAEYNKKDELFFGFVRFSHMPECAEWGYFTLKELDEVKFGPGNVMEINRELTWTPKPFRELNL